MNDYSTEIEYTNRSDLSATTDQSIKSECNICLQSYRQVNMLECNHQFCISCIDEWIVTRIRGKIQPTCPVCRNVIVIISPIEQSPENVEYIIQNEASNRQRTHIKLPIAIAVSAIIIGSIIIYLILDRYIFI